MEQAMVVASDDATAGSVMAKAERLSPSSSGWSCSSWHRVLSENSMPPLLRTLVPGPAARSAAQLRACGPAGRYGGRPAGASALLGGGALGRRLGRRARLRR